MVLKKKVRQLTGKEATKEEIENAPLIEVEKTPEEIAAQQRAGQQFIAQRERLAEPIQKAGLSALAAGQEATRRIGEIEEIKRQPAKTEQQIQAEIELLKREDLAAAQEQNLLPEIPKKKNINMKLQSGQASTSLEQAIGVREGQGIPIIKSQAAEIWDVVQTAVTRKDPLKFVQAKDNFNAALAISEKDIDDVKNGGSYYTALNNLKDVQASISRTENSLKSFSQDHLTWWIDNGASYQAEVLRQRAVYQQLERDLEMAKEENLRARAIQRVNMINAAAI